ncbi:E3 ubiquitin-protein ligase HEL1 NDAI_0B05000 [Naumovozyma dairenensis CBS 421]|uniref:RBR-type E3 ubiquitin transferase n=1 Tax=Naumovozyma dairenensis (strain ATCC 10597 / BCRC 20456 / CBS 421 / NBRC 0211 / NRRL Y-12639) TaxID=1071378 RepID=G0W6X2_NAUDC|nr:hypothetical protein NDAI_0B05000 [Naumovozyma dairenensis CBS 421]CCD23533.1 hypothetical protein NDAI_0B05000 [Naumovozyma dairenensis CBS 421]
MASDEEYSLQFDEDESDEEVTALYESRNTSEFTLPDLICHKHATIISQESEFDIDDDEDDAIHEYEDEDDEDDNDDLLALPITMSTKKALSEGSVPNLKYECLTTQGIYERMLKRIHHLQPLFSIPPDDILILMQHYDWNEERLLEKWTEKMDDLLEEIGLNVTSKKIVDNTNSNTRGLKYRKDFSCFICCDDKTTETFSLECGHEYCLDCYRHYIEDKLHEGNIITCMDCSLVLKNLDIDQIMGHASSNILMRSSIKSFVQKHHRNYKWCPYADCKFIIHLKDTSSLGEYTRLHYSPFVKCNESHRFCFHCGFEVHAPADCNVTNAWIKKARKESDNLNWVLTHTKECPKCSVNIEKNGGCNHMVCGNCKYEFCWICESAWAPHGKSFYQCTMYNNDDNGKTKTTSTEDAARRLKRFTFYYRMFNEHEVSAKLDWKLGQTVGIKVKALQEKIGVSWIEGQFLSESIQTLVEGRTSLKWSFAVAYYSDPSHNLTKIFLDNQILLAKAVEELSELLLTKQPEAIMKKKPDFYNKAGFVENRRLALMECGRDLLCKGICKPTD